MIEIPINLSSMSMVYCDIMEAYQDVQDRNMVFIERFMMVMSATLFHSQVYKPSKIRYQN